MMTEQDKNKTILIVEDEPTLLAALKDILSDKGYNVITAKDGKEGWRQFKKVKPDLVSTGIMMPGIDGVELIKRIRKVESRVPIVVLTGGGYTLELIRLTQKPESYAHAVLQKPLDIGEYLEILAYLLINAK